MPTQREHSRKEWTSRDSIESINAGSLQRIADATEKMAGNFIALQNERDRYKGWFQQERSYKEACERQVRSLRGVITKLKKKAQTEIA
jgi:hypothetical protein